MRDVDISKLPKFTDWKEAVEYFKARGKMEFFGWSGTENYRVYKFIRRKNGLEYFIDVCDDGTLCVIQRDTSIFKNF
ncbi:hypothetical protein [Paenibacillus hexagrammi]|uniref:Phage protein n=1 Tax=Paenibacillus hexagrammi TaxID=2908839 RepID=A0ABY3SRI6_9BACL|nr:hypothetical protein [Paenibacillus sp. YPD9-1]UJF36569.1 hypothetical protein L0M14_30745 [Paenibacillus sp. YPD9-1]